MTALTVVLRTREPGGNRERFTAEQAIFSDRNMVVDLPGGGRRKLKYTDVYAIRPNSEFGGLGL